MFKRNVVFWTFFVAFVLVISLAVWRQRQFVEDDCKERGGQIVSGECVTPHQTCAAEAIGTSFMLDEAAINSLGLWSDKECSDAVAWAFGGFSSDPTWMAAVPKAWSLVQQLVRRSKPVSAGLTITRCTHPELAVQTIDDHSDVHWCSWCGAIQRCNSKMEWGPWQSPATVVLGVGGGR